MLSKLLPWKYLMQRAAHHYGFIDPVSFLARLRKFSQPSEVAEPIELLRAGVTFHSRGLINTKAIQTNLDWVWPYWVEKQFKPGDPSFVPRAFSFSHVNLTHRDWSAVGLPDMSLYPIVDPRGLVTPLYDGWSLDFWLQSADGQLHVPSRAADFQQQLHTDDRLQVESVFNTGAGSLTAVTELVLNAQDHPELKIQLHGHLPKGGRILVTARPYNPEGIQFIEDISVASPQTLTVNSNTTVSFDHAADQRFLSNYSHGDVASDIQRQQTTEDTHIHCRAGMATAALGFDVPAEQGQRSVAMTIDLSREMNRESRSINFSTTWPDALASAATLQVPDKRLQQLYDTNLKTLTLLSAEDVVPGPYTYKRFWFRDACLMMNALLAVNLPDRVGRALPGFRKQQKRDGYFQSQEGEWDSNGQVLWIFDRYEKLSGKMLDDNLIDAARKAVTWIDKKRVNAPGTRHHGLFPAGFSAEHFGPNDHYYWDDFWAIGGLRGIADLFRRHGLHEDAERADRVRQVFEHDVQQSIDSIETHRSLGGIPASPYRRMDSGAIGSMVADYPLQLTTDNDPAMAATANYLIDHSFYKGAFFQNMIHSGQNIYLTLAVAQTLLRQGDDRHQALLRTVMDAASPTGHWPEAIHPSSGGGCMGDGQHGWAAAEFLMMVRNLFVREEQDRLVIGSGLPREWIESDEDLHFGPTLTPWGNVSVTLEGAGTERRIKVNADWHHSGRMPDIDVAIPGYEAFQYRGGSGPVALKPARQTKESVNEHSDVH
ncbi:hypothetical protein QVZ43_11145 [Marinobacter sp. chi1]|uniref:Uncharacterized protein n=1 Tax=Marinobacter suaedae TaxID=3057675 RepID=A0ABT8W210_9GAMM|nr:hypothetical protein [Marinobacter sp. chi1]MDO3722279.1 hypothetical protein [Marinobacter sp. chi1]